MHFMAVLILPDARSVFLTLIIGVTRSRAAGGTNATTNGGTGQTVTFASKGSPNQSPENATTHRAGGFRVGTHSVLDTGLLGGIQIEKTIDSLFFTSH
jgi:hypothetical protein